MIIRGLFELIYSLLNIVLTPFQIIPDMPQALDTVISGFFTFISTPISLALFFFDTSVLSVAIPVLIGIINMEHIWDGILWILKKIPFAGIE